MSALKWEPTHITKHCPRSIPLHAPHVHDNSVSKRVHFILTHITVIVEGVARLFLHYIWKLHGLPKRVVSDHGPQFVALFTEELYRLLGI